MKPGANYERVYRMALASSYPDHMIKVDRKIRYLDKLVDELAKGRAMEKILRR